ncbi:putative anti-sigma factor [Pedobacter sp. BAL39]|uniref:FecR family protein n=1 Tax=Pedobacter sp. BAL39 TaxID=391596 RepID=UPI0001559A24|nr:FecR family protein [Pedobacter sp. BAL39]EDM36258.1 putative anti-sigma factor [Pedobacter sp. BAL39]
MDKNRLQYLHERFLGDQMSPDELLEWKAAIVDPEWNQTIEDLMNSHWHQTNGEEQQDLNIERFDELYLKVVAQPQYKKSVRSIWPRIAVAAAVAVMVLGAGLFYFNVQRENKTDNVAYKNDVAPGRQGATLTLANGKKIRLSDVLNGELAEEAGVVITKSADGKLVYEVKELQEGANKMNTIATANGETYQVRLPDGSLVYLNAASSLTYSATLMEQGKRIVRLKGEAFFEIAKLTKPTNERVPFIVETSSQKIEVLGTHFNVMAYGDEPAVATTLVEGSVKIVSPTGNGVLLKPGEQALNNGHHIKVSPANLENITAWKEDDFYLNHVNFKTAMRNIERWYNVEMIYDQSVPDDIESGGWISRNRPLSAVLRLIESTGQVHFRVEGRKVYVSR